MSARDTLTPELRAEVLRLEDDLRARVASLPDVQSAWREEYDAARAAERTAAAWEAWVDERVTLASVAWVLTTVFVRFCEDNALVKSVWISGLRGREAIEAQQQFLRETARTNADVTDREWLLQAVEHLKSLPATAGLVDDTSPMWLVTPSGDAATRLLNFWRERDENGALIRDLSDPDLDTRFLGDLYQDISEDAKKRYALLQTPVFVEEFILDRTLEPALNERPLDGFKMIDPTCGSGHFLLGGFQRLLDRWHKHAPGLDERERVQSALDSVHGVDINPYAVSIARFRLTVAALQACGLNRLEDAPAFKYHLAAGDSLLHGLEQGEFDLGAAFSTDKVAASFVYETENLETLRSILRNGQYDTVVGNPPYIQVKDKALNKAYRDRYSTCSGKYALTVPFMERFFMLAKSGDGPGWVGQITSNSFMKREFGVPLIERFLPTKDLRLVADTSGAFIPGHGTPTLILVGRSSRPHSSTLRVVLGVRGEPGRPVDPASGYVWSSIVQHVDEPGWDDEWVTVADLDRSRLSSHPWSLSGGGAPDLLDHIEGQTRRLDDVIVGAGFGAVTGDDDVFAAADALPHSWRRWEVPTAPFVEGDRVRDHAVNGTSTVAFPYAPGADDEAIASALWPWRTQLVNASSGRSGNDGAWWRYYQFTPERFEADVVITYAEVASSNHFAVTDGGKVMKQTAPVVTFAQGTTRDRVAAVAATLNTSVASFWLKQNCHDKGIRGEGGGFTSDEWERFYQFNSTNVRQLPVPSRLPVARGGEIEKLVRDVAVHSPSSVVSRQIPTRELLDAARSEVRRARGRLIAMQEELDWETYSLYGVLGEDLTYHGDLPELALGERAFEIVLARRLASGEETSGWFTRHGSDPVLEPPRDWPADYRDLVQRRINIIEKHPFVRLLERPEHKRRWAGEAWARQEERALRVWLLERLEARRFWFDQQGRPVAMSIAVLADEVARDHELTAVLSLWEARFDVPVAASLARLLTTEAVPFLAAMLYKDSGLRKRAAWEATWVLQRREDAGTYNSVPKDRGGDGPIPVPPKYVTGDFRKVEYWSHRGKLDVPKERFTLYPGAAREGDPTPVVGWAGWDHAQQALALATLIQSGEQQGWSEDRLVPLVAGVSELLPWVEQWHSEPDALYGGSSPAEFFSGLLDNYMAKLGATRESLAAWRPPAPTRGRKAKT